MLIVYAVQAALFRSLRDKLINRDATHEGTALGVCILEYRSRCVVITKAWSFHTANNELTKLRASGHHLVAY